MKPSLHAAWVWYRGERFRGFQRQPEGPTVQETLARVLGKRGAVNAPTPAGRTDRGVHARMQVVSFRAPEARWQSELLEEGLGLVAALPAPRGFQPQWGCTGKEYRYRYALGAVPPGWEGCAWRVADEPRLRGASVDPAEVAELLRGCVGTFDFIAFHEKSSARKARTIWSVDWVDRGGGLHELRLRGDRFGRYQVRYLVGSALAAAAGALSRRAFEEAVQRGTGLPGLKAPGEGLVLWEVLYPAELDPFSRALREAAPGVPAAPPFS